MMRDPELLDLLERLLSITEPIKDLGCLTYEDREAWLEISATCADIREDAYVSTGKSFDLPTRVKFLMRHITKAVESGSYLNAASWTQELLGVLLYGLSKTLKGES